MSHRRENPFRLSRDKVLSWAGLKKALAREKSRKRKVVFTNGCFDLIHVGHLKVFQRCKDQGDVLVVGLNSDASVRRLKGPKRPLITQKERAQLLAGFEVIDYVTIFNEDTPQRLIEMVKPDVLVKGGDWKSSQIVGREVAKKIYRVPLIKGHSTSLLIDKIVKRYG